MKRLIVNADGFGFTFGNNRAILEVLEHGFVRSVSVNVTWPAVKEIPTLVRAFPHVSVGIHVNLSVGPPILPPAEIPSLVGPDGEFLGAPEFRRRSLRRQFDIGEMKHELRSQIARLRDLGVRISHWDGHQDMHLYPQFFQASLEVAVEAGLRNGRAIRRYHAFAEGPRWMRLLACYVRHPRYLITESVEPFLTRRYRRAGIRVPDYRLNLKSGPPGAEAQPQVWAAVLPHIPDGLGLAICHPGYSDETLRQYSTLIASRVQEVALFKSDFLSRVAAECGVEPVSYAALDPSLAEPSGGEA